MSFSGDSHHYLWKMHHWVQQGQQHDHVRSSAPYQSTCCSPDLTLSKSSVELLMPPLNSACARQEALTDGLRPEVSTGVPREANSPNCLHGIPRPDPHSAVASSVFGLFLILVFLGQLAHIQENQNIFRTTLQAPGLLLSKLTFKSKMCPPVLPLRLLHPVLWLK